MKLLRIPKSVLKKSLTFCLNKIEIVLLRKYNQIAALKISDKKFLKIFEEVEMIANKKPVNKSIIKTVIIRVTENLNKESLFLIINESKNSGKYFRTDFSDSLNFLEKRSNKNNIAKYVGIIS